MIRASLLLLLAACDTTIEFDVKDGGDTGRPDTDTDTDPGDTDPGDTDSGDTDPGPDVHDLDGDGYEGRTGTGDDCDDGDPAVHPGAYDRPNDGLDADCSGADRTTDAIVVDEGGSAETSVTYAVEGASGLDIALVLDTTCSMGGPISALDVAAVADGARGLGDTRWSFATYQDYAYGSYGSPGADLPFRLEAQMTDDVDAVQSVVDVTTVRSGADGPESGMEALYQAITGNGYDMDCDGRFDTNADVPPFVAAPGDSFHGAVDGSYDASVSGTGSRGGVGFRASAQPVVVLITDNYLRDPDASIPTVTGAPGGCSDDAGSVAVVEAAVATNTWIVGVLVNGLTLAEPQFDALADATGFHVDSDGDGRADDTPVYVAGPTDLNARIVDALEDVAAASGAASATYDTVALVVESDPYGVVSAVTPATFSDFRPGDTLTFTLALDGISTDRPIETTIVLAVLADGEVVDRVEVDVEIAPS